MKKYLALILMMVFISPIAAQKEKTHDVSSEVKALSDFHDVIYQIWHTAWPEKDVKLLKSLTPQVEDGFAKIAKAELPGILRDKKSKWEEGVKKLGVCVEKYKAASSKEDASSLLDAAEKLHSQYEILARVIKPVMVEVDAFHQVLYTLYHYYMPENNIVKIKESAAVLSEKMEPLKKAVLPAKLKAREEQFAKIRTELASAVENLNSLAKADKGKDELNKAVDAVHGRYQELEKIFD